MTLSEWAREAIEAHLPASGAQVAALATSPLPVSPCVTPLARYWAIIDKFGPVADQQLTCACHVHVEVGSDEEGVAVLDRIGGWLPTLLALSPRAWRQDQPPTPMRVELLRLAGWRAARSGLVGSLIGPDGRPAPAQCVVRALIEHVTPALEDHGEVATVQDLSDAVFGRGNGSAVQRAVWRRGGSLAEVVAAAAIHSVGE
ncbi:MAG TPA: glutamate-cysteine ligase family protein [Pseudonocardiaceae bacterium]|nr:glutamate-cysteine ligase family protein [Pseudonocardiaceae bacterium]